MYKKQGVMRWRQAGNTGGEYKGGKRESDRKTEREGEGKISRKKNGYSVERVKKENTEE